MKQNMGTEERVIRLVNAAHKAQRRFRMKRILPLLATIVAFTAYCGKDAGSTAAAAAGVATPVVSELGTLLAGKALVVDVRTPGEFASGHHPRAVNIPVDQVRSRIAEFGDKKKPVVVYCASGNRSGRAKQALESAGYTQVTNAGGFSDLPR